MTDQHKPTVSPPQAQETPRDILAKLARSMLQQDRACREKDRLIGQLSSSLQAERAAHEATKQQIQKARDNALAFLLVPPDLHTLDNLLASVPEIAHPFIIEISNWLENHERLLGETQAELGAAEQRIERVRQAWTRLCDCVGEFEPEDMSACSEYRDMLDSALLALLTTDAAEGV